VSEGIAAMPEKIDAATVTDEDWLQVSASAVEVTADPADNVDIQHALVDETEPPASSKVHDKKPGI